MVLKSITHNAKCRLFCGVASIAALTGKPTAEIVAAVRAHRLGGGGGERSGRGRIAWMDIREFVPVLATLGVSATFTRFTPRPTLERFFRENGSSAPMIVLASSHFRAVVDGRWSDQWAENRPLSERGRCWKPRSPVYGVVRINGPIA